MRCFYSLMVIVLSVSSFDSVLMAEEAESKPPRAVKTDVKPTEKTQEKPALVNTAALEEIPAIDTTGWPESPSKVPGKYIWDDPRFTHWPGIVYRGEGRNLAFMIHNRYSTKRKSVSGSIGWPEIQKINGTDKVGEQRSFVLPAQEDAIRVSGLAPLPVSLGEHTALLELGEEKHELAIRIVDIAGDWPHDHLENGFPVDVNNVPVIVHITRPENDAGRQSGLLESLGKRPDGPAVLLGDPLSALGSDIWHGVDATRIEAVDGRYSRYAALCALAKMQAPWPRTFVYSPGNQSLFARSWSQEEERILQVIEQRWRALGVRPELILLLPPVPVQEYLHKQAIERRALLRRSAIFRNWSIIDLEKIAGPANEANKLAEAAFTNYPIGAARDRIAQAITKALKR